MRLPGGCPPTEIRIRSKGRAVTWWECFDDATFDTTETPLNPGDTILVHTDGITDAENAQQEMFGKARLSELIQSLTSAEGVSGVAHNIVQAVHDFTSGAPQADDITLLAVRFGVAG